MSARFWFESFQNWQSEFLAIASMVWLAVYSDSDGRRNRNPCMRRMPRIEGDMISHAPSRGGRPSSVARHRTYRTRREPSPWARPAAGTVRDYGRTGTAGEPASAESSLETSSDGENGFCTNSNVCAPRSRSDSSSSI